MIYFFGDYSVCYCGAEIYTWNLEWKNICVENNANLVIITMKSSNCKSTKNIGFMVSIFYIWARLSSNYLNFGSN